MDSHDKKLWAMIYDQMEVWQSVQTIDDFIERAWGETEAWLTVETAPDETFLAFDDFPTRSALEFLRPQLSAPQTVLLNGWTAFWQEYRDKGLFYKRVRGAFGRRFTWPSFRAEGEEELGRKIPRSHWWYWPPGEKASR